MLQWHQLFQAEEPKYFFTMAEAAELFKKFQKIWQAGKDARFNLECHAGQAWVHLYVYLPQPHPQPSGEEHGKQHRRPGPSRLRRRARRAAARENTAVEAGATSEATDAALVKAPETTEKAAANASFSGQETTENDIA